MQKYQSRAIRFVDDYNIVKSEFKFEEPTSLMLGVMMNLNANRTLSVERIKEARKLIKDNTSMFSDFRGTTGLVLAFMMSLESNPQHLFDQTKLVYEELKAHHFTAAESLIVAAINIARNLEGKNLTDICQKMMDIYQEMKKVNFWLTGHDDYIQASILALTDFKTEDIISNSEYYFNELANHKFAKDNALQTLSHILALKNEKNEELVNQVTALRDYLKEKKYKIRYHALPILGLLTYIGKSPEKLADSAVNIADWLKEQKGFGGFSLDDNMRFSLAVGIITKYHMNDFDKSVEESVLTSSIQSLIAAQNLAMMTAVVTATIVI